MLRLLAALINEVMSVAFSVGTEVILTCLGIPNADREGVLIDISQKGTQSSVRSPA